jgi:small redox-active disulfide protein 2
MLIEIFGTGCAKCKALEKNAHQAVAETGMDHPIQKVSDYASIASRGILTTPALALDGQVKIQGRVASSDEIQSLLKG